MADRKKVTRRTALAGIGGLALATQVGALPGVPALEAAQDPQPFHVHEQAIPIKGKAGAGLEPIDPLMLQVMDRHGIPGAALAIAKNGKLILAKGYGWSNITTGAAVEPDTLFALASLSKAFTATAILKLVEGGKLGLDDQVFDILKDVKPPLGARVDPRLATITVRQCLNHSGGWDRGVTGDPVNWEMQICRALHLPPPLLAPHFISFAMSMPLNFDPGTDAKYSNVGYIILGEVIARVSGQPYERYVADKVQKPMGIMRAALHGIDGKYLLREAFRYLAGTLLALPPMQMPMVNATGGWSASVVDMARLLTNLDGSRGQPVLSDKTRQLMFDPPPKPLKPRENGTYYGLGWDSVLKNDKALGFFKEGSYQGMRTFMKRLPNGVCWALLYNASMEFDPQDRQLGASIVEEVRQHVERLEHHSDIDLFKEYP